MKKKDNTEILYICTDKYNIGFPVFKLCMKYKILKKVAIACSSSHKTKTCQEEEKVHNFEKELCVLCVDDWNRWAIFILVETV